MDIDISARCFEVNQAIHDYVQWRFLPLGHSDLSLREAHLFLDMDKSDDGGRYRVTVQTRLGDRIASGASSAAHLHVAIDGVAHALAGELRQFGVARGVQPGAPLLS